jgi:carboxyl-terminal processing protease
LVNVTDTTQMKITIARWLTPKGRSISLEGLEPDFEVKMTREDLKKQKDPQFDRAIEFLLKGK